MDSRDNLLQEVIESLGLEIDVRKYNQLQKYVQILLERVSVQRLVGDNTPYLLYHKHIYDSLYLLSLMQLPLFEILDLGTGAGLPGIPLKICLPEHVFFLMDANRARINFLRRVMRELALERLHFLPGRAEEWGQNPDFRERFGVVVSRAVAPAVVLAELALPLCSVDGQVIFYKGPRGNEEMREASKAISICGGSIDSCKQYRLLTGEERCIYIVKKIKNTPPQYPRRVGRPAKQPLRD